MNDNVHLRLPTQASGPAPEAVGMAVILIHGRTQSSADMFALAERIGLADVPYIAIEAAGNSWYPDKFMAPLENNQPYLDFALELLEALVVELEARGIPRERIVLLGFSQGACLACEYLYRHPQRWGGLIAFTGGLIGPPETQWSAQGDQLADMSILISNGATDPWVPLSRSRETADVFRQMGARVTEHIYPPREHGVIDDEIAQARALLRP
ncbi:alpha/beta hydrolase [Pseudomonas lopnurensis]|uniref:alpha/beta hydrolase n=1 Tax=Pseudomonas lopnurensis TaxID=1477517 RepID=UPI0028AFC97B|nr:dienelactone hydrolase family protein [Pseudomonas lopnurensis]